MTGTRAGARSGISHSWSSIDLEAFVPLAVFSPLVFSARAFALSVAVAAAQIDLVVPLVGGHSARAVQLDELLPADLLAESVPADSVAPLVAARFAPVAQPGDSPADWAAPTDARSVLAAQLADSSQVDLPVDSVPAGSVALLVAARSVPAAQLGGSTQDDSPADSARVGSAARVADHSVPAAQLGDSSQDDSPAESAQVGSAARVADHSAPAAQLVDSSQADLLADSVPADWAARTDGHSVLAAQLVDSSQADSLAATVDSAVPLADDSPEQDWPHPDAHC
jgi:hypothetical protein